MSGWEVEELTEVLYGLLLGLLFAGLDPVDEVYYHIHHYLQLLQH